MSLKNPKKLNACFLSRTISLRGSNRPVLITQVYINMIYLFIYLFIYLILFIYPSIYLFDIFIVLGSNKPSCSSGKMFKQVCVELACSKLLRQIKLFTNVSDLFSYGRKAKAKIRSNHSLRRHGIGLCRLRVVPLSLSPSCVTRKKTARKKWPREILGARSALLASRFSRGHFFLAVFSFASCTTD